MKNQKRIMQICRIALFSSLMAISSFISIPTPIPITFQTFALFLMCDCLPYTQACISVLVYLTLGIMGLPVFAGFQSGVGTLLGPTGGFLIGYLFVALLYGLLSKLSMQKSLRFLFAIISLILLYLFGGLWYAYLYGGSHVLTVCILPFIIPDILKITLALFASNRLRRIFKTI